MAIVITDNLDCLVDGVNFGQPADVIANNVALAPGVNVAMRAKLDSVRAEIGTRDTEHATATAALEAEKAVIEAEKVGAITALAEIEAAALANPEDLAAIVLKSIEGRRSAIDKQKAALEAEIAAKQAELDALNAK